ncbi:MAG: hypothetical protein HQM00_13250, partial [Magnetococcales bacterium]|nr:hypothetical protein [Magnetococcales bacterium]
RRAGVQGSSALFVEGVEGALSLEALRGWVPMLPPGSRGRVTIALESGLVDEAGILELRGRGEARGLFVGAPLEIELGDWSGEAGRDEQRGALIRVRELAGPWLGRLTVGVKPTGRDRGRGRVAVK